MGKTVDASMFALRLAASINLRMHLQLKNFKREQGGERRKGGGEVAEGSAACTPAGKNEKFSLGQNSNCGF